MNKVNKIVTKKLLNSFNFVNFCKKAMKTWAITCDIYTLYIQEDMTMANINDLASKIVSRMNQLDSNPNDNNIDATIWIPLNSL